MIPTYETWVGRATATEAFYGKCYALQVGADGPIKVGFTFHSASLRLRALQQACPWPLRQLHEWPATRAHERKLKEELAEFCLRSEWFHPVRPVLVAIASQVARSAEEEPARLRFIEDWRAPPPSIGTYPYPSRFEAA